LDILNHKLNPKTLGRVGTDWSVHVSNKVGEVACLSCHLQFLKRLDGILQSKKTEECINKCIIGISWHP